VLTFGQHILNGLKVTIFFKNLNPPKTHITKLGKADFYFESLESNLFHFENLKRIETIFKIYFRDIVNISREDFQNAQIVLEFAIGQTKLQEYNNELEFDLGKEANIDKVLEGGSILRVETNEKEFFKIHDQNICLGYEVQEILDLYVVNSDDVKKGKTSMVKVRSKSNKIRISFVEKHLNEQ
jgi:hypothetical protein